MLVRYGCGCIGFLANFSETNGRAIIIDACNKSPEDYGTYFLGSNTIQPENQAYTVLGEKEKNELLQKINSTIRDGYAYHEMQFMFGQFMKGVRS